MKITVINQISSCQLVFYYITFLGKAVSQTVHWDTERFSPRFSSRYKTSLKKNVPVRNALAYFASEEEVKTFCNLE